MRSRSRSRSVERRRRRSDSRERDHSRSKDRRERSDYRERKERHRDHDRDRHQDRRKDESRIKTEPRESRIKTELSEHEKYGRPEHAKKEEDNPSEPEKPSFALSGKLLEDTNVFNGVVIKYSEPDEARKPKKRWRFYVFKGQESLPVMHLHRQSAYLIGKDRKIADIPVDHPSCSRQHAVLQYRFVHNRVLPYIIDLGSSNGTFLNNQKIESQRYVELREKDMLKFGFSSREYILLHENSQDDD